MPVNLRDLLETYGWSEERILGGLTRMGGMSFEATDLINASGGKLTPEQVEGIKKRWEIKPKRAGR